MEYLDNDNIIKHFLIFGNLKYQIAEPVGFDAAKFVVKQDDKRYGRDVEFSPSDLSFFKMPPSRGVTHRFDELIEAYNSTGFESDVKYLLEIDGVDYILGQLDFQTADTDELNYFTTNIIQENAQAIIKSREDVEVNLFSTQDLDGKPITPLETTKIYLQATPEKQSSEWGIAEPFYLLRGSQGGSGSGNVDFNPFPVIKESEIENTLSPVIVSFGERDDLIIIEAQNELTNVNLKITDLKFKLEATNFINKFGYATCSLIYKIGETTNDLTGWTEIFNTGFIKQGNPSYEIIDGEFIIEGLSIPRDQKMFLWFNLEVNTQNNPFTAELWVDSGKIEVEAVSTSISSIVETFNLGDAMEYVIKSISGLETDAPRFIGGEFRDQYITNGLLMRNIKDEPFNLSLKKILDYLPELNGDYEISDGKVFFGLYQDFYTDENIGSFLMPPNESFRTNFNDRYSVNKFNFKYSKYEKSNDEAKSREAVHTEMETLLPNKFVDNTKDIQVGFIRDTFLIESTRKEAIKIKDDVASQQDEDIFIIDVLKKTEPIEESEQFTVYHKKTGQSLGLLNDNSINWTLFGFSLNDKIKLEGKNAGYWYIYEIFEDVLRLIPDFNWNNPFEGYASSKMIYKVTATDLTNRTNEGFTIIDGTTTPQGFSNLRFTPKRNTWYYWGQYLASCSFYRTNPTDQIRVTKFIHNGELKTAFYNDQKVFIENAPINTNTLPNAILTPKKTTTLVLCNFSDFWALRTKIRDVRGFIYVTDSNGNTMSLYPKKIEFIWHSNLLEIEGEIKSYKDNSNNKKIDILN